LFNLQLALLPEVQRLVKQNSLLAPDDSFMEKAAEITLGKKPPLSC
jgi:hypothetical protein